MHLFIESSDRFLASERELILSGVSERCLCGALMLVIRRELDNSEFNNYYSDIEYNRNFDGIIKTIIDDNSVVVNITCDLIIHSRGMNPGQDNLVAIEMKRDNHPDEEKNKDRARLRALTKANNDSMTHTADGRTMPRNVCGYIVGVFYEISLTNRLVNIEYYRNGELYKVFNRSF